MRISDWSSDVCSSDLGAGVDRVELVGKDFAGADRGLGQMRHAVHGVRHAQAVPMHRCLLLEAVLDMNAQAIALSHADFRSRDLAVVAPCGGLAVRLGNQTGTTGGRDRKSTRMNSSH